MRGFFAGLVFVAGLISWFYAFYTTTQGEFPASLPSWILGLGSAAIGIQLSQKKAQPDDPTRGEDLAAKDNNRKVAEELAQDGGMLGIMARQWLNAYEKDATIPIFGVRPYWTPTGPGGTPQILSTIGLRGISSDRLEYVHHASPDDSLLAITADDPNPRVRDAARARMRS